MSEWTQRMISLFVAALAVAAALYWLWPGHHPPQETGMTDSQSATALPAACREMRYEDADFIACAFDPAAYTVRIAHAKPDGSPWGSVGAYADAMTAGGQPPVIAMNAGMYHEGLGPVGLLVEDGRELHPLETANGEGNFYLKPNGVFFIDDAGKAGVMETGAYAASGAKPLYATQSGPMLVIGNNIHPLFLDDGTSRYVRNGVGVDGEGRSVFAISKTAVSLGKFARFFRNGLMTPNALFLDGGISVLWADGKRIIGGNDPAGPIVAVFPKLAGTS